jgi:cytochrome c peroxidase
MLLSTRIIAGLAIASAVISVAIFARAQPLTGTRAGIELDESALMPLERLGLRIFFDARLSEPKGLSCAACHDPAHAFTGNNGTKIGVALGSRAGSLGFRDTPTVMYLATVPAFGFTEKDGKRVPIGGMFWDGRAATLEDQAKLPFFNALEMNNADARSLAAKIAAGSYAKEFRDAFGANIFANPDATLEAIARALAAFQRSRALQPFTSKFDAVMRGEAEFSEQEQRGLSLFRIRQKGNCAACHTVDEDSRDPRASLFTDFTYHAVGAPRSTRIPHNASADYRDQGVCGPHRDDTVSADKRWCGYFKVPTLRNIALTAPYMHNGVFDSLRDAVAFYATRDTEPARWYSEGLKFNDLSPSHHANVDVETPPYDRGPGRRARLSDDEIDDIVAFLHTLTDGFAPGRPQSRK